MPKVYSEGSALTGELKHNSNVEFREILTRRDRLTLYLFLSLILLTSGFLIWSIIQSFIFVNINFVLITAVALVVIVEIIRLLQALTLVVFAHFAKDPIPMVVGSGIRVAMLTTIVPGKEPFAIVARTLMAMKRANVGDGNTLDVWLLDEGNDPIIKLWCTAMGVHHFSRRSIKKWNRDAGPYKAKTKHGNHNAWRAAHEKKYDVVAQMDPDHVPKRDFLIRTLGYFTDPDIAFVVAPQVYGNLSESWIAKASAFQAYLFHGIIQRGGNGMGAPLLIGTNHLYRVRAFKQIRGYQDSIIEDHLTSMVIYGANRRKGHPWKGVYTPDILAVGEGPTSYTDYFNQQKRWAYGIWDIMRTSTRRAVRKMTKLQALTFVMLQFFYPSVAASWVLGSITTILFSSLVVTSYDIAPMIIALWVASCASSIGLFYWLRRFNLMRHEQRDLGLGGMALLLMCIPVYVSAAWQSITRRPLTYAVTAKGDLSSPDTISTFMPHLYWIIVNVTGLVLVGAIGTNSVISSSVWMYEHIIICVAPIVLAFTAYVRPITLIRALPTYIVGRRTKQPVSEQA